ncbi:MAG: hypothetical protein WA936_13990 [Erythrobacter sp.]|uniref:hypothetical protein n=1 Tax=Erythrobacter sp. TaxID=1042 RepID=UPI003C709326
MNKLILLAAIPALSLAACSEPEGDTANLGSDATTGELGPDEPAGDGGAPELVNVQAAIDEACPALRARVSTAACEVEGLALETFECEYSFAQDPDGSERTLTLTRPSDDVAWMIEEEPDFCGSLERANALSGEPADVSVDTQPTDD